MTGRTSGLLASYPIAAFALAGILAGVALLAVNARAAHYAFLVVAAGGGAPLAWSTLRNMFRGKFHVDTVAALAIVGSVALGEYAAGALVVLMQSGGEALEDYGLRRANQSLDNLLRRAPSIAHLQTGQGYLDVPAAEVKVGDVLLIRPGDIVAADGIVVEGCGNVDEAALTGEPVPLPKGPGDPVYSGTINLSGSLHVRTTDTAAHSKYEMIVQSVQRAQGERAPINRLANEYTPVFTLVTLLAAGAAWIFSGDGVRALSVLVVATPCPLIIATPLAVLSAINRAASLNIIAKSGAAVEQAATIRTVVFDKTGTLTVGSPELTAILPATGSRRSPEELLALAAGIEQMSSHVLAEAVVREARRVVPAIPQGRDVVEKPGTGVAGVVEGRKVAIGSERFLLALSIAVPEEISQKRVALCRAGKTVAYIALDGRVEGMLAFEDRVRPESPGLISRLTDLGVSQVVMLTGDTAETAGAVAAQIGIRDVRSRLQPEDKVTAVTELARSGPVMMVGDGINDAPALASATVGVALGGHGAGIATDAAHVVITVDNVDRVADTIIVARTMVSVARQGILFGIAASVILMIIAGMGHIPPVTGALLQEAIDLAAIVNALRAR